MRFQGPRANGMPELHKLTPPLGVLQDKGFKVALVTDGRMSGASGKVPAAIHVSPEAACGGPLARLRDGDLVSIDCGAIVDGWHGDAAISVPVGVASAEVLELSRVTEQSLWEGMSAARVGAHLSDIGHAVESVIRSAGPFGIVEEYVGHGIGTSMHMHPPVPNYGRRGEGPVLRAGMALAIEPMATLGEPEVGVLADDWTVITTDGRWAAHWEHTVAVRDEGLWVLTAIDGGAARLAALGAAFAPLSD